MVHHHADTNATGCKKYNSSSDACDFTFVVRWFFIQHKSHPIWPSPTPIDEDAPRILAIRKKEQGKRLASNARAQDVELSRNFGGNLSGIISGKIMTSGVLESRASLFDTFIFRKLEL